MDTNTQRQEKQFLASPDILDVIEVWNTIQGEGPFAGCPATFVRLAGCNFQCTLCDTDYTSSRQAISLLELVTQIRSLCASGLVVVTGGEPFRQNINKLVEVLLGYGYKVQVETNGSLTLPTFPWKEATVVVSPKSGLVHPEIRQHAHAWKFVVEHDQINERGFPLRVLGIGLTIAEPEWDFPKHKIYIQPLDEQDEARNKLHLAAAVGVCMEHGYRLCLQTHKIAGLP